MTSVGLPKTATPTPRGLYVNQAEVLLSRDGKQFFFLWPE